MLSFAIAGLKALMVMLCIMLAFIVWYSITDGYPWREQFFALVLIAASPFLVRLAIRLLEQRRRIGVLVALGCVVFGPTPMIYEASWVWPVVLTIPLAMVWFELSATRRQTPLHSVDSNE